MNPVRTLHPVRNFVLPDDVNDISNGVHNSNGIYGVMVEVQITRFSVKKLRFGVLAG